ncbi:MAG TPA: ATP-binding protein, partial [Phycisphaerae bacterium]|nr:ATP-binding protein [Phycisphaerae bacterium]
MSAKDPFKYFRLEARELLDGLQKGVARLEEQPGDAAQIQHLLRLAHTLKGAARVVRLPSVAELAHKLEDVLITARDSHQPLRPEQRRELEQWLEAMGPALAVIDVPAPAGSAQVVSTRKEGGAGAPTVEAPSAVDLDTVQLQAVEVDAAFSGLAETAVEFAALKNDLRELERADQRARRVQALLSRGGAKEILSVASEASELVADLDRTRRRLEGRVERIARDWQRLHEDTGRLRLIPTTTLLGFLEQAVADAARTLGKAAHLEVECHIPRLDIPVFAGLQQALLHLVRNAVAHGLESSPARTAAGKPPQGRIRITISGTCNRLSIRCEDDGRGIDPSMVRAAAIRRGRLPEGSPDLDMAGAINLLLRGGLSTAETTDAVSGRGVGLDAVKAAVNRLRGEIVVESTLGKGLVVRFEVPTTLSAITALAAITTSNEWLLPLVSVQRIVPTTGSELHHGSSGLELPLDGQMLSFAWLDRLGRPSRGAEPLPTRITAVIVQAGKEKVAVGVDRLIGVVEAVVRPLPVLADAADFVDGASREAGRPPRLVLDPSALIQAVR